MTKKTGNVAIDFFGQLSTHLPSARKIVLANRSHNRYDNTMKERPILYIKPGCPWCQEAQMFFNQHGIEVDILDVNRDKSAMNRMVEISGQTKTPTFELGDFVVADFDTDEFLAELDEFPEVRIQLGIGDNED